MFGGRIGMGEIIVVLVIVLLVFGPSKLPQLARSIGKSVRELKDGLSGMGEDLQNAMNEPTKKDEATPAAKTEDNPDQTKNA